MNILNTVAQEVPLYAPSVEVKKRRGHKPKITLDEEKECKEKKLEEEGGEKRAQLNQLNQLNQKEEGVDRKVNKIQGNK